MQGGTTTDAQALRWWQTRWFVLFAAIAAAVPLVELAKQYYRQVLAEEPAHQEARYNLERALWLQPESVTWIGVKDKDKARERRLTASKIEPGELP